MLKLRLLVLGLLLTMSGPILAQETTTPKPLPTVALSDLNGNPVSLEDYAGDVLVVNFWATWCAPCKHEMPSLGRLQAKFSDQPMHVLAVSADRASVPAEKLEAFMEDVEVDNLTILRAPDFSIMQTLEIPGLPATLIVDKKGREVGRVMGIAEWDAAEPVQVVETLLQQPAS